MMDGKKPVEERSPLAMHDLVDWCRNEKKRLEDEFRKIVDEKLSLTDESGADLTHDWKKGIQDRIFKLGDLLREYANSRE